MEPPDLDAPSKFNSEQETIEEQLDESSNRNHGNKEKKRVKFKDDIVHSHFDDTDLWAHGELTGGVVRLSWQLVISDPNESAQDMINAYQRECMAMKIKPTQILLDQLKVRERERE